MVNTVNSAVTGDSNPLSGTFWTRPGPDIDADLVDIRSRGGVQFFAYPPEFHEDELNGTLFKGEGSWVVTTHAEIMELSKNPAVFSNASGFNIVDMPPEFSAFFGSILAMDDPRHARLRRIVSAGFTPKTMKRLEDSVQRVASTIVDDIANKGEVEFVSEVASALPLKIVCDLMGIPASEYDFVFRRSNVILGAADPDYQPDGDLDIVTAMLTAGGELAELMNQLVDQKRGSDGDDLTSQLANTDLGDDQMTSEELASFFILLVVAGNETTRNAISWGLKFLTDNPDQRERWRSDFEGHAQGAVEEIVRMASPVLHMRRTVLEDTVLGGQKLEAGAKVCQFYYAANRDPKVFDNPLRFDITRDPNPQLGFGGPGPHFCLGAHLARREITVMFRELFNRLPDIEATGEPDLLYNSFVNGIKRLPARFKPIA